MWIKYNPNPVAARVGDCAVRALAKALGIDWEKAYLLLVKNAFLMGDMPSGNNVIGAVLRQNGFKRYIVPNECSDCYTLKDFCKEYPKGLYVVGMDGHIVTVVSGDYYDAWDSGNEAPIYYWTKEEEN